MAIKTTLQQLEEVQAAITAAETAQEMGSASDTLRRANLKTLYDREDVLRARLAREQGGGPAINVGQVRGYS